MQQPVVESDSESSEEEPEEVMIVNEIEEETGLQQASKKDTEAVPEAETESKEEKEEDSWKGHTGTGDVNINKRSIHFLSYCWFRKKNALSLVLVSLMSARHFVYLFAATGKLEGVRATCVEKMLLQHAQLSAVNRPDENKRLCRNELH